MPDAATTTIIAPSLNFEYFFLVIYNLLTGGWSGNFAAFATNLWIVITVLAYFLTFAFIVLLVYSTMRLHQLRHAEDHQYETLEPAKAEVETEHSRWSYIQELIESGQESDWRQAIIEADIMLDDILKSHGYPGENVGDRLRYGDPARFMTLQDAWEAHKIRNQIAHQGSAFELTNQVAYRTIARYKNVFQEFQAI